MDSPEINVMGQASSSRNREITDFSDVAGSLRECLLIKDASVGPSATGPKEPVVYVWDKKLRPAVTLRIASGRLRRDEDSHKIRDKKGHTIIRYDAVRLPSYNPVEDHYLYESDFIGKDKEWHFWGIYDGHDGFATSVVLRRYLISTITQELRKIPISKSSDYTTVDAAISTAFLQLDQRISSVALGASGEANSLFGSFDCIEPAKQGSSALLAMYDPVSSYLRVACVGDSRCVLGRRMSGRLRTVNFHSEWTALALSEDQTPKNKNERDRICGEHPEEHGIFGPGNRDMLGLQATRAFGDNRHKWPRRDLLALRDRVKGDWILKDVHSPPYVTAEPAVTTTEVEPGDFVVLASAGLWKHISSEDAVQCVGMWIEQQKKGGVSVDSGDEGSSTDTSEAQSPTSFGQSSEKKVPVTFKDWEMASPEEFVVEDNNAATHLVRNVLGGKRRDLFRSLMSLRSPDSVGVRDDITVQVIFFGDVRIKSSYYTTPGVVSVYVPVTSAPGHRVLQRQDAEG